MKHLFDYAKQGINFFLILKECMYFSLLDVHMKRFDEVFLFVEVVLIIKEIVELKVDLSIEELFLDEHQQLA